MKLGIVGLGVAGNALLKNAHKAGYNSIQTYITSNPHNTLSMDVDVMCISAGIDINSDPKILEFSQHFDVVNDMELFFRHNKNQEVIAVTGSYGKSSVVTFIEQILSYMKIDNVCVGNIGDAIWNHYGTNKVLIVELSSYQLERLKSMRAKIGVLTNIHPHHLQRHKTLETYRFIKEHIFDMSEIKLDNRILKLSNQELAFKVVEVFVSNFSHNGHLQTQKDLHDEPLSSQQELHNKPLVASRDLHAEPSSSQQELHNKPLVASRDLHDEPLSSQQELHNKPLVASRDLHDEPSSSQQELHNKPLVASNGLHSKLLPKQEDLQLKRPEHRFEMLTPNIVNDSKSTGPEAVQYALERAPENIILICGGKWDEHANWKCVDLSKVSILLLFGQSRFELMKILAHSNKLMFETLEEVVEYLNCILNNDKQNDCRYKFTKWPLIDQQDNNKQVLCQHERLCVDQQDNNKQILMKRQADTEQQYDNKHILTKYKTNSYILFSPGCQSLDQFTNFEERGRRFKQLIEKLIR